MSLYLYCVELAAHVAKTMAVLWHQVTKLREPLPQKWQWFIGAGSIILLLGSYTYLAEAQHRINPLDTTIPMWGQLGDGVKTIFEINERTGTRMIVEDLLATGYRMLLGLSCAVFIAVILGMHMGCFSVLESFCILPLTMLAQLVPTAMLPIFFAIFGTETSMYIAVLIFGIAPSLTIAVTLAVKEFTEEQIDTALTLGASKFEVVWVLMFRSVLPRLFDLIRAHVGPALVYLIAGELLCADDGFGPRIRIESRNTNMQIVYPYVVTLALFGLTLRKSGVILQFVKQATEECIQKMRQLAKWLSVYFARQGGM